MNFHVSMAQFATKDLKLVINNNRQLIHSGPIPGTPPCIQDRLCYRSTAKDRRKSYNGKGRGKTKNNETSNLISRETLLLFDYKSTVVQYHLNKVI